MAKRNNVKKFVRKFTVDRSTWARGDAIPGRLFSPEHERMCCLGFYAQACNVDRVHLAGLSFPREVDGWNPRHLVDETGDSTAFCIDLVSANDDTRLADDEREARLAALFASKGVEVTFNG